MRLLIVIPALNEEENIANIIGRSCAAIGHITANSNVTEVEITVVSDGSTDRTVEIASKHLDRIKLIVFEENRGYGAAIKEAWIKSDAELLSFIDADGTCDPFHFAQLCDTLYKEQADIVMLGRMNPVSEMPLIRKIGNKFFATLLSLFSSTIIRDTASGMRVISRSALPKLLPLPDGLHFTPAMSARAAMREDIKIIEIPLPYQERVGESKLRVFRDGLRFLKVIIDTVLLHRPSRLLNIVGWICCLMSCAIMAMPMMYYLQHRSVLEWMIYRFIVSDLFMTTGCLLFCCGYLSRKIVGIAVPSIDFTDSKHYLSDRVFSTSFFWFVPFLLVLGGGLLVLPSFFELLKTGATYEHWSRFVMMSLMYKTAIILSVTYFFSYIIELISSYLGHVRTQVGRDMQPQGNNQ